MYNIKSIYNTLIAIGFYRLVGNMSEKGAANGIMLIGLLGIAISLRYIGKEYKDKVVLFTMIVMCLVDCLKVVYGMHLYFIVIDIIILLTTLKIRVNTSKC